MERAQAEELVSILTKFFPNTRITEDTFAAYTGMLEELKDPEVAFEAVNDIVKTSDHWPSYATIRETYIAKRNRKLDNEQRLALDREGGDIRELPDEVKEFMARHQIGAAYQTPATDDTPAAAQVLVEADGGACDDCGNIVPRRWLYGKFVLCSLCARSRLRAAAQAGVAPPK